ncbi:hypothetical protein Tco_0777482 [Tanacetum coccineum]
MLVQAVIDAEMVLHGGCDDGFGCGENGRFFQIGEKWHHGWCRPVGVGMVLKPDCGIDTHGDKRDIPKNAWGGTRLEGKRLSRYAAICDASTQNVDGRFVIMDSLVKKKQKGAILELKRRHLKNTIFCTYTPYPAMKIRRISASSAQETRNDQFLIRRPLQPIRRATKEWFTNECIGTISTWDDLVENFVLKFYNLCEHDEEEETDDDNDPDVIDNVLEIFKIDDDLFNFDSPLCIAFEEFNHLLKIDPDLFTYDIQRELPRMVQIGSMSYFQDHKWYDKLMDGKLKDETLTLKTKVEKSWGDATPGNVGGSNVGSTRENQGYDEHMGNETPEQSVCKIRRFEMMKYSFSDNEEYITIKESDHLNHSKKGLDAYRELLRLTNEGWVVTTPDE